jgi:hypothetical protein
VAAAIVSEDAADIAQRCAVPPALALVVHRALRRDPAQRFASAAELASALVPFANPTSLGVAVVAQMSRRSSTRSLTQDPGFVAATGDAVTEVSGAHATLREVSTSVSHEVSTSARTDSSGRQLLVAALAAIVLVASSAVGIAVYIVTRSHGDHAASAAGSSSAASVPSAHLASAAPAAPAEPSQPANPANDAPVAIDLPAPPTTSKTPVAAPSPPPRPSRPTPSAATTASAHARPTATGKATPAPAPAPTAPAFL